MESKPSPDRSRPHHAAWLVSADARQDAQAADACLADDDWLYTPPAPLPRPRPTGPPVAAPLPTR